MASPSASRRRHNAAAATSSTTDGHAHKSSGDPSSLASSLPTAEEDNSKQRRRDLSFFFRQRHYIPISILLMTVLVFGGVSFHLKLQSTPGLFKPLSTKHFVPVPEHLRRTVCVDEGQTSVLRAFRERNWKVVRLLNRKSKNPNKKYSTCYRRGDAAVIWTKNSPNDWNATKPWQRHNQLPFNREMSQKARTAELLHAYAKERGRTLPFIPESYVLPEDREALLKRLTVGPVLRGGDNKAGVYEPWVMKLSKIDNGVGIAMLGPGSDEIKYLADLLGRVSSNEDAKFYMTTIRRKLVFSQKDDQRKQGDVEKARKSVEKSNDKVIVQRYICHELDYQKRKFDLRVYFLIASVDPVVIFAHDGYLRVSEHEYNEGRFDSTGQHLTNLGRTGSGENNTISYEEWEVELRRLVAADPSRYPWSVRKDPLQHIKNQIKSALADLVAASRHYAFRGYRGTYSKMQNGFALFGGDFIVDRDLNVWFTEGQDSPGLLHETSMKRKLNNRLLPATVDIIGDVIDKQSTGQPLFPMHNTGDYELIYTDDYQYRYDFERPPLLGPCGSDG